MFMVHETLDLKRKVSFGFKARSPLPRMPRKPGPTQPNLFDECEVVI